MPQLTVAMSVYNNAPYVAGAIESILAQSFADFTFLIVNDGSTDGSGDIINRYAARDPRIRVIHQPNHGFVAALNLLLQTATTPWLARMDGDDICAPDRLSRQMARAMAEPELGVIGCQAALIDSCGRPLPPRYAKPLTHEECLAALEDQPLINHNSVLLRREVVLAVGGYRAAFTHAEDYDLWTRLITATRFANLADVLVSYRVYPEQVSARHEVEQITNAAIAYAAYEERRAGRPDPAEGLAVMPSLDTLDALFGREGVAAYVRRRVVARILYSPASLSGAGWQPLLAHVHETGQDPQLWRASARLLRAGHPAKAASLAHALLRAG